MMEGIRQDENSINMSVSVNTNVNMKGAAPFETVLVEPTLPLPVRDSFMSNNEMEPSSSAASPSSSFPTPNVNVIVTATDKGKDAKEESFVTCFASTQEPKTKTIGVTVTATTTTATTAAAGDGEIKKKETPSPTDSLQQELMVTHLNPATDIVLVPFTEGSDNKEDIDSGSDLMLYKIVCDYMEDIWSAGDAEGRLQLWQEIAAKVRFLVPLEQNQNEMQSQTMQQLSLSQSQQQQQDRFRKPNRRLPLCFQVQPVGDRDQPDNTDQHQYPNQYRVLLDAENDVRVHSFLARAFGFEEIEESSPARTTRSSKASEQQQDSYEGDHYKSPKAAPRQASDGTYKRPRGRPLLGYDWDKHRGLWVKMERDSDSENDSNSASVSDSDNDSSLLLDDSLMGETDSASNANPKINPNTTEEQNNGMPLTRNKSSRSSTAKAPTDALSMAAISQVAGLLADLRESSLSAKDNKNKKSSKTNGKTTKSPGTRSRRLVVGGKEGTHRGGRDGLISTTTGTSADTKATTPKVPYHRFQDGVYVRPRGRAPSGKTWDVIRGLWVASNTTTSSTATSTVESTNHIDTDRNESSRTVGSHGNDVDNSSDTVDGDGDYGSGKNESRGAWVDTSWKVKTTTVASSQPSIDEKHNGMTVVNANVSANGNGCDKENVRGYVQPRHGRPAFRAATSNVTAEESKPSVDEAFLAYRNNHPRQHRYSTERSNGFDSVATTATAALKKRREPSDVLDLAHRNQDKRRRQNSSAHAAKTSFAGEIRTGYNTSDQHQGDFPKSLGMAPSGVPMVLPAEEYGRHVAPRFEQSTDFGLPGSIPLVSDPFGCQPMVPSQIQSFYYPPGSNLFDMQRVIQELIRLNHVDIEHARSSTNTSFVHFAAPSPDINDLLSHLESAPWSCVLRRRLAGTSCPYTRARLYASLGRVERAEPYLVQFLRCLHQDG
jgi:hypothetical protein